MREPDDDPECARCQCVMDLTGDEKLDWHSGVDICMTCQVETLEAKVAELEAENARLRKEIQCRI